MKNILFLLIFFFLAMSFFAQNFSIEWQKTIGGTSVDFMDFIEQTNDGGYILLGHPLSTDGDITDSIGSTDLWVAKMNTDGTLEWQNSLGGTDPEYPAEIHQTNDGGYIVVSTTISNDVDVSENHGQNDYWIVKLNSSGQIEWQKSYGGSSIDWAFSIQQTDEGGYIVAGGAMSNDGDIVGNHGSNDVWILKLDNIGNIEWQKSLGGTSSEQGFSIQQTTDGGYIVGCGTFSNNGDVSDNHGNYDLWVVKLTNSGGIQWQKTLGGSENEYGCIVKQDTNGEYIVSGYTNSINGQITSNHGDDDFWLIKLNSNGSLVWQKTFGGSGTDQARYVIPTNDGGYLVCGNTNSNDGDLIENFGSDDGWLVKLNNSGTFICQKSFGGSELEKIWCIQETNDGGLVFVGNTYSNDGDLSENNGESDCWIVKLASDLSIKNLNSLNKHLLISPNPSNQLITFYFQDLGNTNNLKIFSSTGQIFINEQINTYSKTIDVSSFSPGIYFAEFNETFGQIIIK